MNNNRHAYLILAHHYPKLLQVLIDMIDDERNDVYLHIDAKTDMSQFASIHAEKSKLIYTKRNKVYWGDFSMMNTELMLFETAHKNGPYLYYHLVTGVDLPLKTQDFIHHFMDDVYRGREFVGYCIEADIDYRTRYYHLFGRYNRSSQRIRHYLSIINKDIIALQKKIGIWRNKNIIFHKGAQWISITDDLCQFILANKKRIKKLYHHTLIADESFVQTLVYDSQFYNRVYDKDAEYKSCMRLIDWDKEPGKSCPHTWTCGDWDELTSSDRLFARKFSEDDMDFIYRLKDYVMKTE
jgi:hypothetical protein